MVDVLIAGVGQLGSRHLQGLKPFKKPLSIDCIDPSSSSQKTALERFGDDSGHQLRFISDFKQLKSGYDFGIVSTNSQVRMQSIESILKNSSVKNLLLEKFLFQRFSEYDKARELLVSHGANSYVNCPRRQWDFYKGLRSDLAEATQVSIEVIGAGWGLCCNSVHFVDLFSFLTNDFNLNVSDYNFSSEIIESKRPGYFEINGKIEISSEAGQLSMTCDDAVSSPGVKILISTNTKSWLIDESQGQCLIKVGHEEKVVKFETPFQSQLTHRVLEQLLETNTCDLAKYDESVACHQPLLKCFNNFFNERMNKEEDLCPIT